MPNSPRGRWREGVVPRGTVASCPRASLTGYKASPSPSLLTTATPRRASRKKAVSPPAYGFGVGATPSGWGNPVRIFLDPSPRGAVPCRPSHGEGRGVLPRTPSVGHPHRPPENGRH